jgi:uncharacterized repeat protein (TIGR02543 family)
VPVGFILNRENIKTEYSVGDILDTTGMTFKISYSNSTNTTYDIEDIRSDLVFSGFDTTRETSSQRVTIYYKNDISDYFDISIVSRDGSRAKYNVSFDSRGGSPIATLVVDALSTIDPPEIPIRDGYYFDGWFTSDTFDSTTLWDFNVLTVHQDLTLYAKWQRFLTVTFSPGFENQDIVRKNVRPGVAYTDIPDIPERSGYNGVWEYYGEWDDLIDGQIINANYTAKEYEVVFIFKNTAGERVETKLPITFNYGNNVLVEAATILAELEIPAPNRQVIVGWKLSGISNTTVDDYTEIDGITSIRDNLYIEALYDIEKYSVSFNFGSLITPPYNIVTVQNITYDTLIPQDSAPTASEFSPEILFRNRFKAWCKDPALTTEWVFSNDRVSNNITLYARWIPLVYVNFYGSGTIDEPALSLSIPIELGGTLSEIPAVPQFEGFTTFWNIDLDGFSNIQSDLEIRFSTLIRQYLIVFKMPDGTILPVYGRYEQILTHGTAIENYPQTPSLEHYSFKEWRCAIADADFNNVTMDMTITALFEHIEFTVIFTTNISGATTTIKTISANSGEIIPDYDRPSNPFYDNFAFDGWGIVNSDAMWNLNDDIVLSNLTLIAVWSPLHLVRFFSDDNSKLGEVSVKHGNYIASVDVPTIPARTGFTSVWTQSGTEVNLSQYQINSETNFTANYSRESYELVFSFQNARSGEYVDSCKIFVYYGLTISIPLESSPVRDGYTFERWDGYEPNMIATKNATFTARFTPWKLNVSFVITNPNVLTPADNGKLVLLEYNGANAITYNQAAGAPANPMREHMGYRFIGWSPSPSLITGPYDGASVEIVAVFEQIFYEVQFILKTRVNETLMGSLRMPHDSSIIASQLTDIYNSNSAQTAISGHTGYNFIGWSLDYLSSQDESTQVLANVITTATKIYAVFALNTYTVLLVDGETQIDSFTKQHGSIITTAELKEYDSAKPDKAFMGWYTDKELSIKYVPGLLVTSGFSLYGRWDAKIYGDNKVEYSLQTNSLTGYEVRVVGFSGDPNVTSITIATHFTREEDSIDYPVVEIGNAAFSGLTNLTEVNLPSTLKTIGIYAFSGCTALTKITIPSDVTIIASNAFKNCTNLQTIEFAPRSEVMLLIEDGAFAGDISLVDIYKLESNNTKTYGLPAGLTEIKSNVFNGATSLRSIILPATLTTIGDKAFYGASSLIYAKFNRSTPPALGTNVFSGTEPGFRIYVPVRGNYDNNVDSYDGWNEFKGKSKIFQFDNISSDGRWAYTVTTINSIAYASIIQYLGQDNDPDLSETIDGLYSISDVSDYAFNRSITKLTIPSDINITEFTLVGTSALSHIVFIIKNNSYINRSYIKVAFDTNINLTELSVTANGTLLDIFASNQLPVRLSKVNILDGSNVVIPSHMFDSATYIKEVNLPAGLTAIGDYAFYGCIELARLNFSDYTRTSKLISIGANAFYNAKKLDVSLATVLIPLSVVSIGLDALYNTQFLRGTFSNGLVIVGNGILYEYKKGYAYDGVVSRIVTIPDNIIRINDRAFFGNTDIVTVMSPTAFTANLSQIGSEAFSGMTMLENVILAGNITLIESKAFANSARLGKFALPKTTQAPTIGLDAFSGTPTAITLYVRFVKPLDNVWSNINTQSLISPQINRSLLFVDNYNLSSARIIAYLGDSNQITIGNTTENPAGGSEYMVSEVAALALPRYITSLTLDVAVSLRSDSFYGLTNITSLTLTNKTASYANPTVLSNVNKGMYAWLISNNPLLTQLSVGGQWTLSELFNGTPLPSHLTRVQIDTEGPQDTIWRIAPSMFKDCIYITDIVVDRSNLVIENIGQDAFKNSGWLNQWDDDIVYLSNASNKRYVVDYKGLSTTVDLTDDSYVSVAPYALAGNSYVEIVKLGSSVSYIGAGAFRNMSSLAKVFSLSNTALGHLNIGGGEFDGTGGRYTYNQINTRWYVEFYVKSSLFSSYQSWTPDFTLKAVDTVVFSADYIYDTSANLLIRILSDEFAVVPKEINAQTLSYSPNILLKSVSNITLNVKSNFNDLSFANLSSVERVAFDGVDDSTGWTPATNFSLILSSLIVANPKLNVLAYNASRPLKEIIGKTSDNKYIVLPASITTIEILDGTTKTSDFMLDTTGKNISSIIFPNSLREFGIGSLENTAWYLSQPDYVIVQNDILYKYKGTANQLTVPASVKIINNRAFSRFDYQNDVIVWRSLITSIRFTVNSKLEEIRSEAFFMANGLTSMDLPGTVHILSPTAFNNCYFSSITAKLQNNGMVLIRGNTSSTLVSYDSSASSVIIPAEVKYILPGAFKGNTTIRSIAFASNSLLTKIWDEAFANCTNLTNITGIPSSLIYIGKDALKNTSWSGANQPLFQIDTLGTVGLVYYSGSKTVKFAQSESAPYNSENIIIYGSAFASLRAGNDSAAITLIIDGANFTIEIETFVDISTLYIADSLVAAYIAEYQSLYNVDLSDKIKGLSEL